MVRLFSAACWRQQTYPNHSFWREALSPASFWTSEIDLEVNKKSDMLYKPVKSRKDTGESIIQYKQEMSAASDLNSILPFP